MTLRFVGLVGAVDQSIPKSKLKRANSPPWIDGEIIHAIHKRNTLRRKAAKENNANLWEKFKQLRRDTKYLIRAKFNTYVQKLTTPESGNNKSRIWSFFKSKTNKGSLPELVEHNGVTFSTPLNKAEAFNSFFASTFQQPSQSSAVPSVHPYTNSHLVDVQLTPSDVLHSLVTLDVTKSAGPDEIPARLLRECAVQIAPSLTDLFNLSF